MIEFFYVIVNNNTLEFMDTEGYEHSNICNASHHKYLEDAKNELTNYDNPEEYSIYKVEANYFFKKEI